MKISEISVHRPVFATMMIATLIVVGLFSYFALPIELFPNVDFPFVVVTTVYPGAAAESVETEVTKKIEDVINEISGVRHITSSSREGFSLIFIEFELSKEGAVAAQDVSQKIQSIRSNLPDNIEEPIVNQYDPESQPILSLVVSGKRPLKDVTNLAKNRIKTRLEIISGVGSVQLVGGFEREILIAINPQLMESYLVGAADVQQAVSAANLDIPSGRIDETTQEYLVRVMGRLPEVKDFNNIIVKNHEGTPVYLSDFARIVDTIKEQRSLSRYNGKTAVALNIIKQSGANVVDVATNANKTIAQLKAELPPDIDIEIVDDNSTFIRDSVH
ncbi:MAG: efflux RND transporter permease subunit, partial [Anaerolineales bacterium]